MIRLLLLPLAYLAHRTIKVYRTPWCVLLAPVTISHHLLRRTARTKCATLAAHDQAHRYRVVKAQRGPWRWRVVQLPLTDA
jgi:hypothetical protein